MTLRHSSQAGYRRQALGGVQCAVYESVRKCTKRPKQPKATATTAYNVPIEKAPFDKATAEAAGKQEQIKFEKHQSDIRLSLVL